ncbi:hypothetical protein M5689_003355 [Euphorbia peplus]|nr:hypothetical protein M5689_003355 [Euphorbia peplus]
MDSGGEEWVLCHDDDDGFTYKILKRHRLLHPSSSVSDERRRKLRKKDTLLNLQNRYQKEIDQWHLLSTNLLSMQDRANQHQPLQFPNPDQNVAPSSSPNIPESEDDVCASFLDKLLSQAEAQEAMINDVSSLCDIAESICNTQQDLLAQSYIDLPIWSSPRELMASLCDE